MQTTLWGVPVEVSRHVRKGIIELRYKGEFIAQVDNPWGLDFTSPTAPNFWVKSETKRAVVDSILMKMRALRKQGLDIDILLQHEPEEIEE